MADNAREQILLRGEESSMKEADKLNCELVATGRVQSNGSLGEKVHFRTPATRHSERKGK